MSGIGDIIAVAQLGYKFAEGLKRYIDEVGAAQESIKALVVEVEQASKHVQGLSELIDGDKNTGFLTPGGLKECQRLSFAFRETIFEFRSRLLFGNGAETDPEKVAAEFLDLSKWRKWHWPLFRRTLDEPRARLGKLERELEMVMLTATTLRLSKMPWNQDVAKKQEDAQAKLKRLTRITEKAASKHRKAQARQSTRAPRARSASPNTPSTTSTSSDGSVSSDDDMLEYFVEFLDARKQTAELERRQYQIYLMNKELELRDKAEREKRLLARAEQMEKEAEKQKRREEARKEALNELEQERITQVERQKQRAEQKNMIRGAMEDAQFEEAKVKEVMDKIDEVMASELDPFSLLRSQAPISETTPSAGSEISEPQSLRQPGLWKGLFRRRETSTPSMFSKSTEDGSSVVHQPVFEAWSLEVPRLRVPLPVPTLLKMIKKQNTKSVLKNLASLPKPLKDEFNDLMEDKKTEASQYVWQLVGIEVTKHRVRIGLFSYSEGGVSVLVILQRQDGSTSEVPVVPKGPRVNRNIAGPFSGTAVPMQKLPSILKKPSDSIMPEKQQDIAPSVEPRVRISSESPELNYPEDGVMSDVSTDQYHLEERSPSSTTHPQASLSSQRTQTRASLPSSRNKMFENQAYNDLGSNPDQTGIVDGIRGRQRSRSRDSRYYSQRYPGTRFYEDDDYPGAYPGFRSRSPSRSRSRPHSSHLDPYMPSIDERFVYRPDPFGSARRNPVYEQEESFYHPRARIPPRRSSTFDSLDDYPDVSSHHQPEDWYAPPKRNRPPDREGRGREEIIIRRDNDRPPRPPPGPVRTDSFGYERLSPYGPYPAYPENLPSPYGSTSPLRRTGSPDSYDIMYPRARVIVGDSTGGNQISSPGHRQPPVLSRRTTMSPEHMDGGNEMALVLRNHFVNEDFEKLKKRAKKHSHRQSSVRKSGDDYSRDDQDRTAERGHGKGKKATIEDYDESDEAGSEVPNKYQSMFNPNYQPPITNGTLSSGGEDPKAGTGPIETNHDDEWGSFMMSGSKKNKDKQQNPETVPPPPPPGPTALEGSSDLDSQSTNKDRDSDVSDIELYSETESAKASNDSEGNTGFKRDEAHQDPLAMDTGHDVANHASNTSNARSPEGLEIIDPDVLVTEEKQDEQVAWDDWGEWGIHTKRKKKSKRTTADIERQPITEPPQIPQGLEVSAEDDWGGWGAALSKKEKKKKKGGVDRDPPPEDSAVVTIPGDEIAASTIVEEATLDDGWGDWSFSKKDREKKKKKRGALHVDETPQKPPGSLESVKDDDDWDFSWGWSIKDKKKKEVPGVEPTIPEESELEPEPESELKLAAFLETAPEDQWGEWKFRRKENQSEGTNTYPELPPPAPRESAGP